MWLLLVLSLARFELEPSRDYRIGELDVVADLTIRALDPHGRTVTDYAGTATISGVNGLAEVSFADGVAALRAVGLADEVVVSAGEVRGDLRLRRVPGLLSLVPPLVAIVLAVWLRQALLALFAGIWVGALVIEGFDPLAATLRSFDTYLPATVADSGHAAILLFTMALGGTIGIVGPSGGSKALIDILSQSARTRRAGLVATWLAGLIVFFDDYANCLLVGNTIRPFTDSRRISREKLSFIVDATAAPVSALALVSTWIGYQLGVIDDAGVTLQGSAYDTFLSMLPYSFYGIFTIVFVGLLAFSERDFGPMYHAERRAITTGAVLRAGATPLMDRELTDMPPGDDGRRLYWHNAVLPIAAVIGIVVVGLYVNGRIALGVAADDASLRDIIGSADSNAVLLWAAFGGSIVAFATALATRALALGEAMDAWIAGVKSMVVAVLILVLAWGIGDICKSYLQTGPWLLSQVEPSPQLMPFITFVVAGAIALATGSSFSTMAIVIPIAAPIIWSLTGDGSGGAADAAWNIRYATLAAVLSGAVFGDHCSPISDTTIMSSMASAADHIDHVRTQAPYAAAVAAVTGLIGFLPAGYGLSPWLSLPVGVAALAAVVFLVGRRPDAPSDGDTAHAR
jgi:Na+/H+ antiporter NhaC